MHQDETISTGTEAIDSDMSRFSGGKKKFQVRNLIERTQSLLDRTESELESCKAILLSDLAELEEANRSIGFERFETIFEKLGLPLHYEQELKVPKPEEIDATKDRFELFRPKEGRMAAFTGALLGAGVPALGVLWWWSQTHSVPLRNIFEPEYVETFGVWMGTLLGLGENAVLGIVVFIALILGASMLIYLIVTWLVDTRNLNYAHKQFEEAQRYISDRERCKEKTETIDAHVRKIVETAKDYQTLLDEKYATLERVYRFEKLKNPSLKLHKDSQKAIEDCVALLRGIHRLLNTPVVCDGELCDASTKAYQDAMQILKNKLKALYGDFPSAQQEA